MKIIASDYDGTLRQNNLISERDTDAILSWRESGNLFGIVTGRHEQSILDEVHKNNLPFDFIICATGAIILDYKENIIFEKQAQGDFMQSLYNLVRDMNGLYFCTSQFTDRQWYTVDGAKQFRDNTLNPADNISKLKSFHEVGTRFTSDKKAKHFVKAAQRQFGEFINPQQNGNCVDISAKGTSKMDALYIVSRVFGCEKENIITVGDNHNDIEMIKEFNGYAIKSGKLKLRLIASATARNIADVVNANL